MLRNRIKSIYNDIKNRVVGQSYNCEIENKFTTFELHNFWNIFQSYNSINSLTWKDVFILHLSLINYKSLRIHSSN